MTEIQLQERLQAEEEFYSKTFYHSFSGLSKLLWAPSEWYKHYILYQREEKNSPALVVGKCIHALILNNHVFDELFIISPDDLPTGNTKLVIDKVFKYYSSCEVLPDSMDVHELEYWNGTILETLANINLHQSLKTDQQRLDKIITDQTKNYWNFLRKRGNKDLIDQETYQYCQRAADVLKNNPKIADLLGIYEDDFSDCDVYNEIHLQVEPKRYSYGFHGYVDSIKVAHKDKVIHVNDIKTTSKGLDKFEESVSYFSYWLQAIIYIILVQSHFSDLIDKGYTIEFHFIVIDQNFQAYPFRVSYPTLQKWLEDAMDVFNIAQYHYENKKYELPYKFCKGLIEL